MKKILTLCSAMVVMLALSITLVACGATKYKVTLDAQEGATVVMTVDGKTVTNNSKVKENSMLKITITMGAGFELDEVLDGTIALEKVEEKDYYEVKITKDTTINVTTQEKGVESLSIDTQMTKSVYYVGETLDITGLVVAISYVGGDTRNFTPTMENVAITAGIAVFNSETGVFGAHGTLIRNSFSYNINYGGVTDSSGSITVWDVITAEMKDIYCDTDYNLADLVTNIEFNGETDVTKAAKLSFSDFSILSGTAIELSGNDSITVVETGVSKVAFTVKANTGGLLIAYPNRLTADVEVFANTIKSIEWDTDENGAVPTTYAIAMGLAGFKVVFVSSGKAYVVTFENDTTEQVVLIVNDPSFNITVYYTGTTNPVPTAFAGMSAGDVVDACISYTLDGITKSVTYTVELI